MFHKLQGLQRSPGTSVFVTTLSGFSEDKEGRNSAEISLGGSGLSPSVHLYAR